MVLLTWGVGTYHQMYVLDRDGGDAIGEVVSFSRVRANKYWYVPTVRFDTPGGKTIAFTSSVASKFPKYEVGEKVDVIFPLDNPQNSVIKGVNNGLVIGVTAFGGLSLIAGIIRLLSPIIKFLFKRRAD